MKVEFGRLSMHDLLRDMGRNIVRRKTRSPRRQRACGILLVKDTEEKQGVFVQSINDRHS